MRPTPAGRGDAPVSGAANSDGAHRRISPWFPDRSTSGTGPAPELGGTRVLGVLQEAGREGLVLGRLPGADGAGEKPRHRVDDDHGRQLTPAENIVADADLVGRQMQPDPLVDPFVPPAEQQQGREPGELLRHRLVQPASLGRQQYGRDFIVQRRRQLHRLYGVE